MSNQIQNGCVGIVFSITFEANGSAIDISNAQSKSIIFKKPDGTKIEKSASFYTDGTDGIITYTSASGDIDQNGVWRMQGYCAVNSSTHYTSIGNFRVLSNL